MAYDSKNKQKIEALEGRLEMTIDIVQDSLMVIESLLFHVPHVQKIVYEVKRENCQQRLNEILKNM